MSRCLATIHRQEGRYQSLPPLTGTPLLLHNIAPALASIWNHSTKHNMLPTTNLDVNLIALKSSIHPTPDGKHAKSYIMFISLWIFKMLNYTESCQRQINLKWNHWRLALDSHIYNYLITPTPSLQIICRSPPPPLGNIWKLNNPEIIIIIGRDSSVGKLSASQSEFKSRWGLWLMSNNAWMRGEEIAKCKSY